MATYAVFIVFGSMLAGVVVLYIAQNFPSRWARVALRVSGLLLILWPFLFFIFDKMVAS